jgi:hypothetical protein
VGSFLPSPYSLLALTLSAECDRAAQTLGCKDRSNGARHRLVALCYAPAAKSLPLRWRDQRATFLPPFEPDHAFHFLPRNQDPTVRFRQCSIFGGIRHHFMKDQSQVALRVRPVCMEPRSVVRHKLMQQQSFEQDRVCRRLALKIIRVFDGPYSA